MLSMVGCVDRTVAGDGGGETQTNLETGSTDTEPSTSDSETDSGTETTDTETTDTETTDTETGPLGECGDGIVDSDEECDDANAYDGDDCLNDCTLASCGDGVLHPYVEECDDANSVDDDACSNSCIYNLDPLCFDDSLPTLLEMNRNPGVDGPGGVQLCDRAGVLNQSPDWVGPGWYRFGEYGGTIPLLSPPEDYSCGATSGGWIDAPYPAVEDGRVDVTICFAFGPDPCARSVEAVMINCWDEPNVLRLPDVPDCDLRYCMDMIISP